MVMWAIPAGYILIFLSPVCYFLFLYVDLHHSFYSWPVQSTWWTFLSFIESFVDILGRTKTVLDMAKMTVPNVPKITSFFFAHVT